MNLYKRIKIIVYFINIYHIQIRVMTYEKIRLFDVIV